MLAADPDLDCRPHRSAAFDRDADELADTVDVDRLERIVLEQAVLEVEGQEPSLGVVARHAEGRLGQVVRAEREELGVIGELPCTQRRPGSSIIVPTR